MSKAHIPPVPPQNQSRPPGGQPQMAPGKPEARPQDNASQHQGRSADIKQNTTHKGYQQDR